MPRLFFRPYRLVSNRQESPRWVLYEGGGGQNAFEDSYHGYCGMGTIAVFAHTQSAQLEQRSDQTPARTSTAPACSGFATISTVCWPLRASGRKARLLDCRRRQHKARELQPHTRSTTPAAIASTFTAPSPFLVLSPPAKLVVFACLQRTDTSDR